MTTYGLQVKNSSGNVIIDGQYKNFAKWDSGTTTLAMNTGLTPAQPLVNTISFTATNQMPLVAIRPATSQYLILYGLRKTSGNYDGFYIIGNPAGDFDWIVYIAHPTASAETYGLRVYNSSGALSFDSGYKYFSIYQINTGISLASPNNTGPNSVITHAGISNPYYFLSPLGYWVWGVPVPPPQGPLRIWRSGISKIDSTSAAVGWFRIFSGADNFGHNEGWNPTLNLMVLK
jgi:hypothetical protein